MKYLLIIFILVFLGCDDTGTKMVNVSNMGMRSIITICFDGCEYVVIKSFRENSITHKGNCTNTFHKR